MLGRDTLLNPCRTLCEPSRFAIIGWLRDDVGELGFATAKPIKMYGERFELIEEGLCTVVRVVCANDPTVQILRIPTAILVGASDRFQKNWRPRPPPKRELGRAPSNIYFVASNVAFTLT